jgi:uncharacterized membrane protein YphA (DoxX/SURF4 family)
MKINQPIGSGAISPLLLRVPLGAYFLLAGYSKFPLLPSFIDEVKAMGVLSGNLSALYATLLPYLEVFVGIMLLVGMWTTLASVMASILLVSFIFAFGIFSEGHRIFNKDLVLLSVACSLLYSGPGPWSIDKRAQAG